MNFCQWKKSIADYVTDETYKKTRLEADPKREFFLLNAPNSVIHSTPLYSPPYNVSPQSSISIVPST